MAIQMVVAAKNQASNASPGAGGLALTFMLMAAITLGMTLRHLTIEEILPHRAPFTGSCHFLSLLVFALMPWLLTRKQAG